MSYKKQELLTLRVHVGFSTFLSYYVSLLSEFCVVMSVTISAKKCSVRPDLQLFVGELVSYLRYLCLFSHSGAQRVLCFCFICLRLV